METQADNKILKCDVCGEVFKNLRALSKHKKTHKEKYKCKICEKTYKNTPQLVKHLLTHKNNKESYECDICQNTFKRNCALVMHKKTHQQTHRNEKSNKFKQHPEQYEKSFNQKSSNTTQNIILHSLSTVAIPFKREKTEQVFTQPIALNSSLKIRKNEKPYKCEFCASSFKFKTEITSHIKLCQSSEEHHKCNECGKLFARLHALKRHKMSHSDEKPHECPECGKILINKSYLEKHILRHLAPKPYNCQICQKSFIHSSAFSRHKRIHAQSLVCKICNMHFPNEGHLYAHKRVHSGKNLDFISTVSLLNQTEATTSSAVEEDFISEFVKVSYENEDENLLDECQSDPLDFVPSHASDSMKLKELHETSSKNQDGNTAPELLCIKSEIKSELNDFLNIEDCY